MSPSTKQKTRQDPNVLLYALFVLVVSFFTYFYNFGYPADPFWDEPYHIASAQKYLSDVFFMEQHPPLGKLLIAAGEGILDMNENDSQFIQTDYATGIQPEFSFVGYRLFPTLLGWLTAVVLFFIFFLFTRHSALSALLSFLYIFDNAQIVHSRGAMVDSPLTFFGFLTVLLVLLALRSDKKKTWSFVGLSLLAGASFGAVMTTKLVGLIFVLTFLWAAWMLRRTERMPVFILSSLIGFIVVFIGVWHLHFSLGTKVEPSLSNGGYYQSSEQARQYIAAGEAGSLAAFPVLLRDAIKYVPFYSKGVPKLDLCKPGENGSPSFFWPIGAKTINYRWATDGDRGVRYLYLVPNPVGWALGFLGVLACTAFVLSSWFLGAKITINHKPEMYMLLALYWGYMIAISQLDRVMYLYHYFTPLTASYVLFGLFVLNVSKVGPWVIDESKRMIAITILGLCVFLSFQYYRPLSYYAPITNEGVEKRAILPLWELRCAHCDRTSSILMPPNN